LGGSRRRGTGAAEAYATTTQMYAGSGAWGLRLSPRIPARDPLMYLVQFGRSQIHHHAHRDALEITQVPLQCQASSRSGRRRVSSWHNRAADLTRGDGPYAILAIGLAS